MKKEVLKQDLILYSKLQDEVFRAEIKIAFNIYISLKISNMKEYYIYQVCTEELKKVTYEEMLSYKRLLDLEYFSSIQQLYKDIINDNKIIHFPKSFN